jgi:hypothetical protein
MAARHDVRARGLQLLGTCLPDLCHLLDIFEAPGQEHKGCANNPVPRRSVTDPHRVSHLAVCSSCLQGSRDWARPICREHSAASAS